MKAEFDFPRFEDLKLGPLGETHGCGCLLAKGEEVMYNSGMLGAEAVRFYILVTRACGGKGEFNKLTNMGTFNSLPNRRKAYKALEQATEAMGYEIGR